MTSVDLGWPGKVNRYSWPCRYWPETSLSTDIVVKGTVHHFCFFLRAEQRFDSDRVCDSSFKTSKQALSFEMKKGVLLQYFAPLYQFQIMTCFPFHPVYVPSPRRSTCDLAWPVYRNLLLRAPDIPLGEVGPCILGCLWWCIITNDAGI